MEEVVQLLTENCAAIEVRANIIPYRFQINNLFEIYKMEFPPQTNRVVRLFDLPECETKVFDLLRNPERLSGFRIRDKILWIRQQTKYSVSNTLDSGLRIELKNPRWERIKKRR